MKNRLTEIRKKQKWSQAELARRLDISRQAVNGFESGKFTPSLDMALKIASLFDMPVESIFLEREGNLMQTLKTKIDNFTQWLPKGERFTDKAIKTIEYAQKHATLLKYEQVEPENILYSLGFDADTIAAKLLVNNGWSLDREEQAIAELPTVSKVHKFSLESQYVLEQALNLTRLKQQKQINTEHLLLSLIQLMQLKNDRATDIFNRNNIDRESLLKDIISSIA